MALFQGNEKFYRTNLDLNHYVLIPLSLSLLWQSSQLGCACSDSVCSSAVCDHVYLFDNDYEDAKDIHGKPMHGRFPYDERGRVILEVLKY